MKKSKVYVTAKQKPTAQLKINVTKPTLFHKVIPRKLYIVSTKRNFETKFKKHKVNRAKANNCIKLANCF